MSADMCEYCNGTVEEKVAQVDFRYKGHIIYIKNVPVGVCNKCGERYFDAKVYKKLEEIARKKHKIKNKISFPLANYEELAV